jgi:hypothetical protein
MKLKYLCKNCEQNQSNLATTAIEETTRHGFEDGRASHCDENGNKASTIIKIIKKKQFNFAFGRWRE